MVGSEPNPNVPATQQPFKLWMIRRLRRLIQHLPPEMRQSPRITRLDRRLEMGELYRTNLLRWYGERARNAGARIGENCRFYSLSIFSEPHLVEIGNNVIVSGQVMFVTHDGAIYTAPQPIPGVSGHFGRIRIGDNCFIGMRAIIMPNVELGKHCIVAAGAVVMDSFPDNCVIAGNPAKYVCPASLYHEMKRRSPHTIVDPEYPFPALYPAARMLERIGHLPLKAPVRRNGGPTPRPPRPVATEPREEMAGSSDE